MQKIEAFLITAGGETSSRTQSTPRRRHVRSVATIGGLLGIVVIVALVIEQGRDTPPLLPSRIEFESVEAAGAGLVATVEPSLRSPRGVAPEAVPLPRSTGPVRTRSTSTTHTEQIPRLDNDLIAYFQLNGNAADSSDGGNDGQLFNVIPAADRLNRPGQACAFDGTGAYIRIRHSPSIDSIGSAISMCAWCYVERGTNGRLVRKINTMGVPRGGFMLSAGTMGINLQLQLTTTPDSVFSLNYATPLPVNTWSHVAAIYDGDTARIYLDGIQVQQAGVNGAIAANQDDLFVGASDRTEFYKGRIDELRIYRRRLSTSEIALLSKLRSDN